jgi:hypothetical protein
VIFVTPALTPTTTPDEFTVAVFGLSVDQVAAAVTSFFVPSGNVADALICCESVRPTAHGEGDTPIADTDGDDVDDPQATQRAAPKNVATTSPSFMSEALAGAGPTRHSLRISRSIAASGIRVEAKRPSAAGLALNLG